MGPMGLKHSSAPFEGIPHNLARSISSRMHIPLLVTHVWVKIFKYFNHNDNHLQPIFVYGWDALQYKHRYGSHGPLDDCYL
jgi:hypothetical protein